MRDKPSCERANQDDSYCGWVVPSGFVTCWMALDDTSAAGGTIETQARSSMLTAVQLFEALAGGQPLGQVA